MNLETREYLINARKTGVPVKKMMEHLHRSESSVQRYLKELGLTVPGNLDITAETVKTMYDGGMTCSEIAKHFGISHAAVTDRLDKYGIKPDKVGGIRQHFEKTYDLRWPAAKALMDDGLSFSKTARAMRMRPENLRKMMQSHSYHKAENDDAKEVLDALRVIIDDPACNHKRKRAAEKYRDGIIAYVATFKALPQASQLARHMGISPQTVSSWFEVHGLEGMLSAQKKSYLLSAVLNMLDDIGIRYDLNRRNIIQPYEIDVWLYDFDTGLEINPVTTHSPDANWGKQSETYHQEKSLRALDAGIGFAQVYDFDLTDAGRWKSLREWLDMVVHGQLQPDGPVSLDRFLKGTSRRGDLSGPECVWVNPNTLACEFSGDPKDLVNRHFYRVYTAGYIR